MGKLYNLAVGCADASVLVSDQTCLIDCHRIDDYAHLLPASKRLRGVFVTHQHADHYSGLEYLRKQKYSIDFLIYSPYKRRPGDNSVTLEEWKEFASHRDYFAARGTELRRPYKQDSFDKPWWKVGDVRFWILGPTRATATSSTRELHDACLVVKAVMGNRRCLFTGDASDANLRDVAKINHNCDDILHASHHGSINGADLGFIKSAKARYTVISTKAGVYDNVPHPTALKRYADNTAERVLRTDKSGTVTTNF